MKGLRVCNVCGIKLTHDAGEIRIVKSSDFNYRSNKIACICLVCWDDIKPILNKVFKVSNENKIE